jgi:hypothetical protein
MERVAWKDETRNWYRILVGKAEGKRMVLTHRRNIILKWVGGQESWRAVVTAVMKLRVL